MKQIWAPWRMEYILDDDRHSRRGGCAFCVDEDTGADAERLVLFRGEMSFVIMNRFPYNNGHLLVAPYRHVADLCALTTDENREISELLCQCREVLVESMQPQGMNIGLNLGEAAGAGIADHLHWHLVPRWPGDTNFMPVLGETRVIPQHLSSTYDMLSAAFARRK